MVDDVIVDIRGLLTEIKPLISEKTELGSSAAIAQANAVRRLDAVCSELLRIRKNLTEWQPGPSEKK